VPGVSSAIAAPAYAGIPVTLRHSSTSFLVVTGHEELEGFEPDTTLDWDAVAKVGGTIVLLMGVAKIGEIAKRLVAGGRDPETPVTSITWGTRPEQTTVRATLATIGEQVLAAPATIVIGDVAAQNLSWFEHRPLLGRRVVVTRPQHQASELVRLLRDHGAAAIEAPTIAIAEPADDGAALCRALWQVSGYDWVVVTSANGARRVLAELRDARDLGGVQIAAIGPGTAAALAEGNITADLVPDEFVAESLVAAFPDAPAEYPGRVLIARAEIARDVLPDGLRARGWEVDIVDAYRTVPVAISEKQFGEISAADAITFTSSSTVEQFVAAGGREHLPPVVACIGPVTAATARESGLPVTVEADPHTMPGLVDALIAALRR
jgi:uroporphyrinogen III methyltransferase/synthase